MHQEKMLKLQISMKPSHKTKVQQEPNATPHVKPQEASSGTEGPGTDTVKITENETSKYQTYLHMTPPPQKKP